jgi:hypothetical protein
MQPDYVLYKKNVQPWPVIEVFAYIKLLSHIMPEHLQIDIVVIISTQA